MFAQDQTDTTAAEQVDTTQAVETEEVAEIAEAEPVAQENSSFHQVIKQNLLKVDHLLWYCVIMFNSRSCIMHRKNYLLKQSNIKQYRIVERH